MTHFSPLFIIASNKRFCVNREQIETILPLPNEAAILLALIENYLHIN